MLIWSEQGIGDTIMFSALLAQMSQHTSQLLVQLDKRLIPLFQRSMPHIDFFASHQTMDEKLYESHLPMGSLCQYFCTSLENFKKIQRNYLCADKARAKQIRKALAPEGVPLCGISWKSSNDKTGSDRSVALKAFINKLMQLTRLAPFDSNAMTFVSLQYGDVTQEIAEVKDALDVDVLQCADIDNFKDLDGFAALIEACDLVISIDNSTVHFAGALGKPVWVLLPFKADWRWMINRHDSVWYPSVKLYRQTNRDDWDEVLTRVQQDLLRQDLL